MLVIDKCHPRRATSRRKLRDGNPPVHVYPSDPTKDELIGRLKASLEWSQKETSEYKLMNDQNALFRRVTELTNERNKLQGVYVELQEVYAELASVRRELARYKPASPKPDSSSQLPVHLPQVTIMEAYDGETLYTYVNGEWVAERPANG